jgi:hypothetical protein
MDSLHTNYNNDVGESNLFHVSRLLRITSWKTVSKYWDITSSKTVREYWDKWRIRHKIRGTNRRSLCERTMAAVSVQAAGWEPLVTRPDYTAPQVNYATTPSKLINSTPRREDKDFENKYLRVA